MEEYVVVRSDEIIAKAERLGYKRFAINSNRKLFPFLFCDEDGDYTTGDVSDFNKTDNQEITQADFLKLPEPIQVGDWCKFTNQLGSYFFKVKNVDGDIVYPDDIIANIARTAFCGHSLEACTKLTPEQIEVLCLK